MTTLATRQLELRNEHLLARFDEFGNLVHLSTPRGGNLVAGSLLRYFDSATGRTTSNQAPPSSQKPEEKAKDNTRYNGFQSVRVDTESEAITSVHRTDHFETIITWRLPRRSPLLIVETDTVTLGTPGRIILPAMPGIALADNFTDVFEDPRDLYFDGAETEHGKEMPPWRVFFRKGYQQGLLLATRSKEAMAHFNYLKDTIEWRPHSTENYSTETTRPILDSGIKQRYRGRFEIGPWSRQRHDALLRSAKLDKPIPVTHAPPRGRPRAKLKGLVLRAVDHAGLSASARFRRDRWLVADMPWTQGGSALLASTGVKPPPVRIKPNLAGPHRVIIGVGDGNGATLRVSGEEQTRYRLLPSSMLMHRSAFHLALSGKHQTYEVDFGVIDLTNKTLDVGRFPDTHGYCVLDYIRFESLQGAALKRWQAQESASPILPLSGLNDVPDIAHFTDGFDPDPQVYTDNLWAHTRAGVRKVYWRIDGQCSDFPSKQNTMRYVSAKVHGVFSPQAKAYGRALRKVNMLTLAVEAANKFNLSLYGWMRFNSYMGNVASDFYKQHPQYWEEWDNGRRGAKLCLAFPEVRRHKINILVEAASYGLQGLCLGFLRHPPVLQYAPILCETYERKYGSPPPRDPNHPDTHHRGSLPHRGSQQAEYERWWQHRADYLTQFGRELRQALREAKLEHVKIAIWIRPHHCLFDGIDMPAWLNEKLCDEVVSDRYAMVPQMKGLEWPTPEFQKMVRQHVPLIHTLPMMDIKTSRRDVEHILSQGGFDGICTYESDYTVLESEFMELYRSLRK